MPSGTRLAGAGRRCSTVEAIASAKSHKEGLLTKLVDPKGNIFQFDYENDGRLKKHTDPPGAGGERLFLRDNQSGGSGFEVDVTTKTGPGTGDKLETTYQVENLPEGVERRTNILPGGLKATTEIEPNGKRTTTFPDGTTTTLVDKGDQRFGMQAPIVSSLEISTGGLTQVVDSSRTSTPLPDLTVDTLTDTTRINGRTFTKTYTATPSPAITRTTPAGRESVTELDAAGRPIRLKLTTPPGHPFELYPTELSYYDALPHKGRLKAVTQGVGPDARTTTFFYNGQGHVDHIEDPLGRTVSFEYDAAGRTRIKTLADGNILEFVYDANGNVEKLAPPRLPMMLLPSDDELHRFDHGPLDFLTSYTPPKIDDWLAGSTTLTYTPNRLLDATTKPVGQTIDPHYDPYGRLDYIGLPGPEVLDFSYYDFADTSQPGGKLHAITSSQDGVTLSYTYLGSLLQSVTWSGNVSGSIEWQYDNDFRVASERMNGADTIAFDYGDADGMLTQAGALTLIRDQQTGTLTGTTIGNLTDTYGYNKFGELTDYEVNVAGTTKYAVNYTLRDNVGRVVRKTESIDGEPEVAYEYHYDDADQLMDVFQGDGPCDPSTCTQLAHYEYSLNGNRTLVQYGAGQTISDIQHDAQDRLTKYGDTTYYHDANGERSQKTALGQGTTKYTWDALGNLRSVTLPNQAIVEYIIDGGNHRVGKKVNGVLSKTWLYDGSVPSAELDAGQTVMARFVYATKGHVPDYMVKNGTTYRLVTDQLGSVRLVLDVQTGEVKQRIDYDEFGRVLADSSPGLQPFGFAGGLYDPDTGLVRFGARDYDAETGRWLAKDPILFGGGDTNLFAYVANDPVNAIDPDGLALQNVAMASALNDGLLSWLGFGTLAQGLRNRADGMLAMSNDASFALGLAKYRQGTCQIGAGTIEAAGRMQMIAGAITIAVTLGATFAARGTTAMARTAPTISKHAAEQAAARGITEAQIRVAVQKGTQYFDRLHGTVSHVLNEGFASGKTLVVARNAGTNTVTTVIRQSKPFNRAAKLADGSLRYVPVP